MQDTPTAFGDDRRLRLPSVGPRLQCSTKESYVPQAFLASVRMAVRLLRALLV
jgi:hypothetical protein